MNVEINLTTTFMLDMQPTTAYNNPAGRPVICKKTVHGVQKNMNCMGINLMLLFYQLGV